MRPHNIGNIFWAWTLPAIGVLLLVAHYGYAPPVWIKLARFWPLLIILYGLVKLIDYRRSKKTPDFQPLFSAWEVAMLVLFVLCGGVTTAAANLDARVGNIFELANLDMWDITGNTHQYTQHLEMEVRKGVLIEIVNSYGGVDVRPWNGDRVVVDVTKSIRASAKEQADRLAEEFTFSIKIDQSGRLRIVSSLDDNSDIALQRQHFKSTLTVRAPRAASIQVNNRYGRVSIRDLEGDQFLTNQHGQVDVRRIHGSVRVENRNGDVDVNDIEGAVRVTNAHPNIRVDSVDISYPRVAIRDVKGTIDVNNRHGDVLIDCQKAPQRDILVSAEYGDVSLRLPEGSSFLIDARTDGGFVHSEFPGITARSNKGEQSLSGRLDDGLPKITITNRSGSIRLRRR